MKALVNGDLVVGLSEGDGIVGIDVPESLRDVPQMRMRCVDGELVDAANFSRFFIDGIGQRHVVPGEGRQPIDCAWDAQITLRGGSWTVLSAAEILAPAIKAECSRRIVRVLKDEKTRENVQAYASELLARVSIDGEELPSDEASDLATARAARAWVTSMQAACRSLIAAADADFSSEDKWPIAPPGAAALYARF